MDSKDTQLFKLLETQNFFMFSYILHGKRIAFIIFDWPITDGGKEGLITPSLSLSSDFSGLKVAS